MSNITICALNSGEGRKWLRLFSVDVFMLSEF